MRAWKAWWRRVRDGGVLTGLLETFALAEGELVLVETPPDRAR
jgi:hypothetical protein